MPDKPAGVLKYFDRQPPLACLAAADLKNVALETAPDPKRAKTLPPSLQLDSGEALDGVDIILRYLARLKQDDKFLYGHDALSSCQVDQWLAFAPTLAAGSGLADAAAVANEYLSLRTYLVGHRLTLADVAVWAQLTGNLMWAKLRKSGAFPHVERWLDAVSATTELAATAEKHAPKGKAAKLQEKADAGRGGGDTGAFVELQGAQKGKVVTRFPPEPSGYLHIGHAKAALLNQYFKEVYDGKLLVRFDDTNPSKEKDEYTQNILKDIKTLGLQPATITHTSDYFPQLQEVAESMIKAGMLYGDNTLQEQMQEWRRAGIAFGDRDSQPTEETLRIFAEMLAGSEEGKTWCLRIKVDGLTDKSGKVYGPLQMMNEDVSNISGLQHPNKALADPVVYRCNPARHWRTGDKYKAYPTYDLACPFVDALEGVTHALRSSEYSDREPQFLYILDCIRKVWKDPLPQVALWDFSRLNFVNTVLSKRKLTQLVDAGKVDGWTDPRFPTVQGIFRRGLQLDALKEFIILAGASKNVNLQEWDKLWSINKRMIDTTAPRHTAVVADPAPVPLLIVDGPTELQKVPAPLHKKNPDVGTKTIILAQIVLLDAADAEAIAADVATADGGDAGGKPGAADKLRHVTLMDWGSQPVVQITGVTQDGGRVTRLQGQLAPTKVPGDTKLKLTWLAEVADNQVALQLVELGPLISKKAPEKDDEIFSLFNPNSKKVLEAYGDSNMRGLAKGTVIQLERKGYWIVDEAWNKDQPDQPIVLIDIPDGRTAKASTQPPAVAAPKPAAAAAAKPSTTTATKTAAAAAAPVTDGAPSASADSPGAATDSANQPVKIAAEAPAAAASPPAADAAPSADAASAVPGSDGSGADAGAAGADGPSTPTKSNVIDSAAATPGSHPLSPSASLATPDKAPR